MILTKYNTNIDNKALKTNINRLTNQFWKLIPMRENNENWQTQLNIVILEIAGLKEIIQNEDMNFVILLSKLEGLNTYETSFDIYRTTVFKCISLLREL